MKHIVLLRGINVGGHKKVLMADLKALFEECGCSSVETYIQSGNVVCTSKKKLNSEDIEKAIKEKFAFDVPVTLRTADEIEDVIKGNLLARTGVSIDQLYVVFLQNEPSLENIQALNEKDFGGDQLAVVGEHVYVAYETKASNSKLTNNEVEKILGVTATMRNWKTVMKLYEMTR